MSIDCSFYLQLDVNPWRWGLPEEYLHALHPHMASEPTPFYLPWPFIPPRSSMIMLPGMEGPFNYLVAEGEVIQFYNPPKLNVFARVEASCDFNFVSAARAVHGLHEAARFGFLLEDLVPLRGVLENAGLHLPSEEE